MTVTGNSTLTEIEQANARVELRRLVNEAIGRVWHLGCGGNFHDVVVPVITDVLAEQIVQAAEYDLELGSGYVDDIVAELSRALAP